LQQCMMLDGLSVRIRKRLLSWGVYAGKVPTKKN